MRHSSWAIHYCFPWTNCEIEPSILLILVGLNIIKRWTENYPFAFFASLTVTKLLKSTEKVAQSQTVNFKPKQSAYSKLDTNKVPWAVNLLPFNWDKLHWFPWNTIFTLFVSASTGICCKSQLAFNLVKWGKPPWHNTASWLLLSF